MNGDASRVPDLFVEENPPRLGIDVCHLDCPFPGIGPKNVPRLPVDGDAFREIDIGVDEDVVIFAVVIQTSNGATRRVGDVNLEKILTTIELDGPRPEPVGLDSMLGST